MFYWFLRNSLSWLVKLLWIKKVSGLENIPKTGGLVLACNHQSWLDAVIIGIISQRRLYYLVGEKIYDFFWLKWILKFTGQIRVDRSSGVKNLEAIQKGVQLLKQGQILCIFPEGGLAPSKKIRQGYIGVARFALLAQVPILPVGIKDSFDISSIKNKFPKFKKVCQVRLGRPMILKDYYGLDHNTQILQEITDQVMGEIKNLCEEDE